MTETRSALTGMITTDGMSDCVRVTRLRATALRLVRAGALGAEFQLDFDQRLLARPVKYQTEPRNTATTAIGVCGITSSGR